MRTKTKFTTLLIWNIFGHNVKDVWNVKFANITRDKAFEKLVALETLKENKDIKFHLVNTNDLWTKEQEPLVLTDEVKDNQEELPF